MFSGDPRRVFDGDVFDYARVGAQTTPTETSVGVDHDSPARVGATLLAQHRQGLAQVALNRGRGNAQQPGYALNGHVIMDDQDHNRAPPPWETLYLLARPGERRAFHGSPRAGRVKTNRPANAIQPAFCWPRNVYHRAASLCALSPWAFATGPHEAG